MPVDNQLQWRRGTAAEWTSTDPILAGGEVGYETDTRKFKIGDGSTAWVSLDYSGDDHSALANLDWSAAGHTMDSTLDMLDQDILNVGNLELNDGGSIYGESTVQLITAAAQAMYFDAGALFSWRDVDDSDAVRMTLDSATGLLAMNALTVGTTTLAANLPGYEDKIGIKTATPDSVLHIKADVPGVVGNNYAGQIIIQNPADDVTACAVITGYESDGSGNPDQQLWYLGSSSSGNEDIIYLNRRNAKLVLGTNNTHRVTILAGGNVGIGTAGDPAYKLDVAGNIRGTTYRIATVAALTGNAAATHLQGQYILFRSHAGVEYGRFTNTGAFGIGTSAPAGLLGISKVSGNTVDFSINQAGVVNWELRNLATSGNFTINNGGVGDAITIIKTTNAITLGAGLTVGDTLDMADNLIINSGHIEMNAGAYIWGESYVQLISAAGQAMYFDAGALFSWRDKDDSNATRMSLDSATAALEVTGATAEITVSRPDGDDYPVFNIKHGDQEWSHFIDGASDVYIIRDTTNSKYPFKIAANSDNNLLTLSGGALSFGGNATITDGHTLSLQESINFTGAAGENMLAFPNALQDAFTFWDGTDSFITFDTADEEIQIGKTIDIGDNDVLNVGNMEMNAGGLIYGESTISLATAAGQDMYFDAGGNIDWRDTDNADALLMRLVTGTGGLNIYGTFGMPPQKIFYIGGGAEIEENANTKLRLKGSAGILMETGGPPVEITTPILHQDEMQMVSASKTLVDGVATGFVEVLLGVGEQVSGDIFYTIYVTDGTDFQTHMGGIGFVANNKAGTVTCVADETYTPSTEIEDRTAGTLTDAVTCTPGAGKVTVNMNANTSLGGPTITMKFTVRLHSKNTITPL